MDSTTQRLMTSAGGPIDPFFENVTMLLHGDGTNGAQNNTFIDSSTNNFTITRNGNTTQGSLGPFGNRWSNYFSSDTQYINLPASTNLNLDGDFTIEAWVYKSGTNGKAFLGSSYPTTNHQIQFDEGNVAGRTGLYNGSTWQRVTCSSSPDSQWFHLAYVRSGTTVTVYLNGVSQGTFTSSTTYLFTGGAIGALGGYNLGGWIGYISNFRIVKGTAVYTGNFTPSTTPLTAITNTQLLACQSNRFLDNSTNNFTLTPSSGVSVRPFSPFAPSAPYSTSANGGSGYFDGLGDCLTTPNGTAFTFGTGNFSIEAWVYLTATPAVNYTQIIGSHEYGISASFILGVDTNLNVRAYISNSSGGNTDITGGACLINAWNHVMMCRTGTTLSLYLNGFRVNTATSSIDVNHTPYVVSVGADQNGDEGLLTGYISNVRVIKGTHPYDATLTTYVVPAAPLTAITNTSLLLNFTNAGIVDSAADNVLETVGNAQISTSVKKYGTGSLSFDGTGDYLSLATSPLFGFNSGEFTIEFWLYPTSVTGTQVLVDFRTNVSQAVPEIYLNGTSLIYYLSGADRITATSAISQNTWQHVALVKSGTTTKLYVNGTNVGSPYSDTNTYLSTAPIKIGTYYGGDLVFYTGYIDDLRITKGVARYTANFTVPDGPFPDM